MQLILELFSAIAFALWTGRMRLRGEIDITWKRPWPVLRQNSDSAFTSWEKTRKISQTNGDLRSIVNLNVLDRCCSRWPCKVAGMLEPSVPLRKSTPRCVCVCLERVVPKTDTPVFVNDAVQSILMKLDVGTELVLTVVLCRIQKKNEFELIGVPLQRGCC